MRKYIKKQVLDTIAAMEGAHEVLPLLIDTYQEKKLLSMLTTLQETAIDAGSILEKESEGNQEIISLLEEYCELLWKCSQMQYAGQKKDVVPMLVQKLEQFRVLLEQEEDFYHVVFLPYKASMWDCMESVWEEACKDKNCRCFVIPLPYFDKKPDGEFGEEHYEEHLFPEYVPITSFEEYSLEDKHPEIIYIHNPYDEYNFVTSVAPEFYSPKLKTCTEMLVYIPYYIAGQKMPDSHRLLPAYYHVDKIILQNEGMIADIDPAIPREKLLAMGSPKADKIHKLCQGIPEIPAEWEELICHPDGSRKKVIMYNISISGLLEEREKLFQKMEYVFKIAENEKNVILLWRPHPLMEATLQSMAPSLQAEYERLRRYYREKRIGIYDQTPDPSLSVACSDAYLGEATSSMVHLFGIAGKPIFILNNTLINEENHVTDEEMRSLSFADLCVEDSQGFFVSNRFQALCRADLDTGKTKMLCRIPESEIKFGNDYGCIYKKESRLYMTPLHTSSIGIYDLEEDIFQKIYIGDSVVNNFCDLMVKEDEIILKPSGYPGILRYHTKTGKKKCLDGWVEEYDRLCEPYDSSQPRFAGRWLEARGACWLSCLQCGYLLEIDLESGRHQFHPIGKNGNTYRDVVYHHNLFWLLPYRSDCFATYDPATGNVEEFGQEYLKRLMESSEETDFFGFFVRWKEDLLVTPTRAGQFAWIDTTEKCVRDMEFPLPFTISDRKFAFWKNWANVEMPGQYLETQYLQVSYDERLLILEEGSRELKKSFLLLLEDEDYGDILCDAIAKRFVLYADSYICHEDLEFCTLSRILKAVSRGKLRNIPGQKNWYQYMIKNLDKNCGENIHKGIMEETK